MSNLQHDRITELCRELRLGAMSDLYGAIAQNAAKKKDVSYSDFLEEVLRAEARGQTLPGPRDAHPSGRFPSNQDSR
jgi:hypothetical protein